MAKRVRYTRDESVARATEQLLWKASTKLVEAKAALIRAGEVQRHHGARGKAQALFDMAAAFDPTVEAIYRNRMALNVRR